MEGDPWEERKNAIFAWYLIYWKAPLVRKYINKDVFKLVLKYLDTIDLSVPIHPSNRVRLYLHYATDGYCWRNHDNRAIRTPCHVCMRPCAEWADVLCLKHSHLTLCTGRTVEDRKQLIDNVWKCKCNGEMIRMKIECAWKIPHVILPK